MHIGINPTILPEIDFIILLVFRQYRRLNHGQLHIPHQTV